MLRVLNPMKLKDYVTLGNVLGGFASAIAALEGSLDWAALFMVIAWLFDSFDGVVARMTGGGNKFGEVLDNVADLVAYSMAPGFIIYVAYHNPRELGGAGWPIWAAGALASLPIVFGCVRFARNNVKEIILPEFHIGLPRTVYALYIATLFTSHVYTGGWMIDPRSAANPILYGAGAVFIAVLSWLTFTMIPYCAKPKAGARAWVVFSTYFFLITAIGSGIVGLLVGEWRIFLDGLMVNFSLYVWIQYWSIPRERRQKAAAYVDSLIQEWKREQGQ